MTPHVNIQLTAWATFKRDPKQYQFLLKPQEELSIYKARKRTVPKS